MNEKKKIVQSLNDVELRFQEAQNKLETAKNNLALSSTKAKEIETQATPIVEQNRNKAVQFASTEIKRLQTAKTETINVEKQKLIREMRFLLTNGAVQKAIQKVKQEKSAINIQQKLIDQLLQDTF